MRTMRRYGVIGWLALLWCVGCAARPADPEPVPAAPDYADPQMWYRTESPVTERRADVFYILPTCVWDWQDEAGRTVHYADPRDPAQREAMRPSYELAASIFGVRGACFAPYYRQITLDSWMAGEETIERRFGVAMGDIHAAFARFIREESAGRPFVLAGFSQGAKGVVELLRELPDSLAERLVAAYVIGYRVTEEDLAASAAIRPATGADGAGVTVCYNSVAEESAICPVLSPSRLCINPLNWHTDGEPAPLNDTVTVRVDSRHGVLLVEGFDPEAYYVPSLGALFPVGNYHLQELFFYRDALAANVALRTEAWYDCRGE